MSALHARHACCSTEAEFVTGRIPQMGVPAKKRRGIMKRSITIALAALAILGVSTLATEARAHSEQESGSLASTGVDPDARGKVKLTVRNITEGRLDIQEQKADPTDKVRRVGDGVVVGP